MALGHHKTVDDGQNITFYVKIWDRIINCVSFKNEIGTYIDDLLLEERSLLWFLYPFHYWCHKLSRQFVKVNVLEGWISGFISDIVC